jgi:hypothetical protein
MSGSENLSECLEGYRVAIEERLREVATAWQASGGEAAGEPGQVALDTLASAMIYALEGGKRLRGAIVLAFCDALGGRAGDALPFAAAMEMVRRLVGWQSVRDLIEFETRIPDAVRHAPDRAADVKGTSGPVSLECGEAQDDVVEATVAIGRPQLDQPRAVVRQAGPDPVPVLDLHDLPGVGHDPSMRHGDSTRRQRSGYPAARSRKGGHPGRAPRRRWP